MNNKKYSNEEIKNILLSYGYIPVDKYINNRTKFNCKDKYDYLYEIRIDNLFAGMKPILWGRNNERNFNSNINNFIKKHYKDNEYIKYELKNKKNKKITEVTLRCKCGNLFTVDLIKMVNGYYKNVCCNDCKIKNKIIGVKKSTEKNIKILEENGYEVLEKNKNISFTENVIVKDKDGFIGKTSANKSQKAKHFATFSIRQNKDYFIYNVNLWLKNNYCNTRCIEIIDLDNAKFLCECGEEMILSVKQIRYGKCRCDKCTNKYSSLESKLISFLSENNIDFITQYKFKNCKDLLPLPFDFYLKKYNVCIEVDGKQHYCFNSFFGGEEEYNIRKKHDKIKDNYCKNNHIRLIRIPYYEFDSDNFKKYLIDFIKE